MENQNYLNQSYLDILFEGRNKDYGAYILRRDYDKRMFTSFMTILFGLSFIGTVYMLLNPTKKNNFPIVDTATVSLDKYVVPKLKQPEKKKSTPPPTRQNSNPEKLAVKKHTQIKIVKDQDFDIKNQVHKIDELVETKISTFNQVGKNTDVIAPPTKVDGVGGAGFGRVTIGDGDNPALQSPESNTIGSHVSSEARFPAGVEGWRSFLTRNLRSDVPTEYGAPSGRRYNVIVSFIVDKNGNVSNVKAETDPGYGMADEAIRVIKSSGKWIPATQNGRSVIYRQRQGITFEVLE